MLYGRKICSGYGLSEASPVVAINYHNTEALTNVAGTTLVGVECKICNDDAKPIDFGCVGSLWIRGDNIMLGYYKARAITDQVLKDGWLNTGDLATLDKAGSVAICGRVKDIIIHKGFNIYPTEVENILLRHPMVIKAAVVGEEDDLGGQVPVAFLAVRMHTPDLDIHLREICLNNLAAYKIPRRFICLDDLPMNATGKVDKKQLQQFRSHV
jgi:long-chain acyl-CoA synthetase